MRGDSGITWNIGLIRVWGVSDHRDSDQTRWAVNIVILFGVDPDRRPRSGRGRGHDETQPAYPL